MITVDAVEESWTTLRAMPTPRSGLEVVAVNNKIYAIGGSTAEGFMPSIPGAAVLGNRDINEIVGTNEEYDPVTDTWTTKASMHTARIVFASAVYQNKVYCIGGKTNNGFTAVNEVYDPKTDTWNLKTEMPTAEAWLTASVVDNKIYVIGTNSTYVYYPETDSWATSTPPPKNTNVIQGCNSAVFDNTIYVIGGLSQDQTHVLTQIYNPETDMWTEGKSPPAGVSGGVAVTTTGQFSPQRIYVLSGEITLHQSAPLNRTQFYDPKTNNWTLAASMPTSRYNFGAAVINDTIYAIGGHTHSYFGPFAPSSANEQYTPTGYIPEFSSWVVLPLFLVVTLVVVAVKWKVFRPT